MDKTEAIKRMIKAGQSPHIIIKKHRTNFAEIKEIRDSMYPVDGSKIYPVGANEQQDKKKFCSNNNLAAVKKLMAGVKKGDKLNVTAKTFCERGSDGFKIYDATVEQVTENAIYARANGIMECYSKGQLACGEVLLKMSE